MVTTFYRRRGKRLLDITGASAALVISLPLQIAIAAIIRKRLGPPIFFRQARPGLRGNPFTLLKFRTMSVSDCQTNVNEFDQARLTPFGRWLRSTSMDELPELLNVLRGEMSLVGPRPLLMEYLERYSPDQARRHEVKPGLTGWAQVNGRNSLTWDEKFSLDNWYVDNLSFDLDIQILWHTVFKVIKRSGVSSPNHETMPEFKP